MDHSRQQTFQKLRQPCVDLSSTALKFKGKQASVKDILHALKCLLDVLDDLGRQDVLDEKLAEYAFFPLSHIFNQSQRLSSRCLEVAVRALQVLVARGWRQKLAPEMGKQLLILLTLLAGGRPGESNLESPGDDLKVAAFECTATLIQCMGQSQKSQSVFDEVGARTIVDQNVYMLLEAITDAPADVVQLAALEALSTLHGQIVNRVILASLLPRTVSALTKALQPSTVLRRTQKVLQTNLELLTKVLHKVLNDDVSAVEPSIASNQQLIPQQAGQEDMNASPVLDASWLHATSSQVKLALASIIKLRNHDKVEVRKALAQLCVMVIEECPNSLATSLPLLVETLVVLANDNESTAAFSTLKRLATYDLALAESLKSSVQKWTASLPRLMQGIDDRPKERVLKQVSTTFEILSEIDQSSDILDDSLAFNLIESITAAVQSTKPKLAQAIVETDGIVLGLTSVQEAYSGAMFEPVLLNHASERDILVQLQNLIKKLGSSQASLPLIRSILDRVTPDAGSQPASIWLALNFLRHERASQASMDTYLNLPEDITSVPDSKAYLVSDLYSLIVPLLTNRSVTPNGISPDWRLSALALESLVLQADQLGTAYRPELIETLYPVLSLLGEPQPELRVHAMTALNMLAKACEYTSAADMLIGNVDYLVNSIALKLNTFDISPQAPQVLLMMVQMCGASLIPYLDDLVGSIFAALDSFHGYPRLVELLFEVLNAVVKEGTKRSQLAITDRREAPDYKKKAYKAATIDDILGDLRAHNARRHKLDSEDTEAIPPTPHRPWNTILDGPPRPRRESSDLADDASDIAEEDSEPLPPPEKEQPLSRSHALLLRITESTPSHLASPSPRVRLTLLHLLTRIAPHLATDENTFLPLINAVWPALIPRLLKAEDADAEGEVEPAYITIAAAETVSALCVGAGDFMASRIEDLFPGLEKKYRKIRARTNSAKQRSAQRREHDGARASTELKGTVDLDLRLKKQPPSTSMVPSSNVKVASQLSTFSDGSNTSDRQVLDALINLFITIVNYVRITDDMGDTILDMLAPVMDEPGKEDAREALERWNADAVWLVREQMRMGSAST